jgi:RND family efflux transporter MFP subunit
VETKRRHRHSLFTVGIILVLCGCDHRSVERPSPPPPSVDVAKPLVTEIVEQDEYTGRLAAIDSVDVRARVTGYVEGIHFADGQLVKKGDLLFTLDPRPFKATLDALQGEALQADSRLALARNDLERAKKLIETKAISQEDFDTRAKTADASEATVAAAKGRTERARLDLEFTEVRAPMSGRIGRHLVSAGNLISGGSADSTILTNIVTLEPLYCYWDVSEQALLKYLRLNQAGLRQSSRVTPTPVRVALLDELEFTHPGHTNFIENQMDALTGTLRVRAVLDNAGLDLLPGVFVRVQVPASEEHRAILIPDRAISADQSERFVYVVGQGNVVTQRRILPGRLHEGLRIVTSGLDGAEAIVVDGLQRVRPGAPVNPQSTTLTLPSKDRLPAAKSPSVPQAPAEAKKEGR